MRFPKRWRAVRKTQLANDNVSNGLDRGMSALVLSGHSATRVIVLR